MVREEEEKGKRSTSRQVNENDTLGTKQVSVLDTVCASDVCHLGRESKMAGIVCGCGGWSTSLLAGI